MKLALSFDDVSIAPAHSELSSREDADISSDLGFAKLSCPIAASPMDTVCGIEMAQAMKDAGGIGVHHRYCDKETLKHAASIGPIAVSPSLGIDFIKELIDNPYTDHLVVMIDVASGDSKIALDFAEQCVELNATVISGNIVTESAARRYWRIGVNIYRVGLGGGSACSTRRVAGVGIPQFTAIKDIYEWVKSVEDNQLHILSDGGIRDSGDAVKALAAGSSAVICGYLLAGADEAPGRRDGHVKEYRGMASSEALQASGRAENTVEGVSGWVKCTGPVKDTLDMLGKGIRAGLSYCGASSLSELRKNARFVQVTQAGWQEGLPRI